MALYVVPQSDAMSDPNMAALVARLRATCPKPEAITSGAQHDATLALLCFEWIGRIESALGDRATPPLLQWDGALDGACRKLATRDWYNQRGRARDAGADKSIDTVADGAMEYLERLRASNGSDGKSENPRFVDSGSAPRDAPHVVGSATADSWIERRAGRAYR